MSSHPPSPVSASPETADHRLDRVLRQFRQLERMAGIGTWRLTIADNRVEWSDQAFAIHGRDVGEHPTLDAALDYYPPDDRAIVAEAIARTIATGEPYRLETDLINALGDQRRVRAMGEIELQDGVPVAVFGVVQDISDQHAVQQRLRQTAATDDLTGLANRGAFRQHLGDRIAASRDAGSPLALLLIDLDGFKAVNDAFGHLAGDDVLREVAAALRSTTHAACFPARIGGDEFAVIVGSDPGAPPLATIIARLLDGMCRRIRRHDRTVEVSASIGAAWLTGDIDSPTELIARADAALYEVKRACSGAARIFGGEGFIAVNPRRGLSAVV